MRVMPLEVIAEIPDQMFVDIQAALPISGNIIRNGASLRWPDGNHSFTQRLVMDAIEPMLYPILETANRHIRFIEFAVENGLILPNESQRTGSSRWHKDGDISDRVSKYITANCFLTEFQGRERPSPGELVKFRRERHRSPINLTENPIARTWIRALVHH